MADLTEHALSCEQVFPGKLLDVRRDRVRLPDGHEGVREYVIHPGAVVIIPITADGRLLLERQFRYPVGLTILELPAGKIDRGEPIEACARRELLEETGYVAATWRHLGVMHPCVGYSNERIEIFLATGLSIESAPSLDHGEHLEVLTMSLDEALDGVRQGAITDAKTITALFWAEKVLNQGW